MQVCWVLLSAVFGTKELAAMRASVVEPGDDIFSFGQLLPIMMLIAAVLTIRQAFMSARQAPPISTAPSTTPSTAVLPSISHRSSRFTSIGSASTAVPTTPSSDSVPVPTPAPGKPSSQQLSHLLSQERYVHAIWLLPTLLNVGAAIFLVFQVIACSGGGNLGGNASDLFASLSYSFAVSAFACCAVILVGFTLEGCQSCRWAAWCVGLFALQPFAGIVWLSCLVMQHRLHFGTPDQMQGMGIVLAVAAALMVEYVGVCLLVAWSPKLPSWSIVWSVDRTYNPAVWPGSYRMSHNRNAKA
ncbi:hypothetical protein F5B20DRAFT_379883 [Whalleya microplaca]|nr:hypothetical protein F5B20DRAFT_379883 [Whalleya microplaca]